MRRALFFSIMTACTVALAPFGASNAAEPPETFATVPCTSPFYVTAFDVNANAVVVRAVDLLGSFTGTITAYGADRTWTATIGRAALVNYRDGGHEASIIVRADGPIEGIAYAPTWAPCTFRAGTLPRAYSDKPEPQRPILTVGNPQPLAPPACAKPYIPPAVQHAVEPNAPEGVQDAGYVRVAVALDARGAVRSARVVESPSKALNVSALSAATRSEYTGAIFRCEPVPGSYEFAIQYN